MDNYIWKDKKRYFGMPISFTKYYMSEDRLFLEKGLLNTNIDEVLLYRVRDISVSISLFQKLFKVGTIEIISSDKTNPTLYLQNIQNPRKVKEIIHEYTEKMKIERRMHVGELLDNDIDYDNGY